MKKLVMVFAAGTMLGAVGWARADETWAERLFKAKYGRNSPSEEARQKAAQDSSAWREGPSAAPGNDIRTEDYFKAKYGRSSPSEEARQKAVQETTAWREGATEAGPTTNWLELYFRAKFGRGAPTGKSPRNTMGSQATRK